MAHPELETRDDPRPSRAAEGGGPAQLSDDGPLAHAVSSGVDAPSPESTGARMHPLTLRFPRELDEQFADEYFERTLSVVRLGLAMAFVMYGLFGVLDTWIAPDHVREIWTIRYAIECPTLAACLAFTYAPAYRRYKELALSAIVVVMALGITAMTAIIPAPGSYLYYAGLVLVIVFTFTLIRLSVPYAVALAGLVIVVYVAVALWLIETPPALLINNLFFLVSSAIIGGIANYSMERYARTNFLQRRLIERRTRELEQKNEELIESRAATARSAQRSELIFAALTEALPGTVLDDRYRVEEKVGSGGFGTVYRGEHILLHHPVAIKVFRPVVGAVAMQGLDRFRVEGISACRINHSNAVTVLDFGVSAGSLAYLVMELLHGRSLADELRAVGKLPAQRCARIMAAVCAVLAEAHAAGIVHRDIKPSNVFLHHQGKDEELVKVIDFGIAKLTDETRDAELQAATATGMFMGTPAYMAPERLINEPYDGRADVYSVGVMMFETLCGRLPFGASGPGAYWPGALMNPFKQSVRPTEVEPGVPPELEGAILRAMARDSEERPTAAELEVELRDFLRLEEAVGVV